MTQKFTVPKAKANLPKLIDAAIVGENIIITEKGESVVRLVAIAQSKFKIGFMKDRLGDSAPDFFTPMDEDGLAAWGGVR